MQQPLSTPVQILVVEDSADDAALVVRAIQRGGMEVSFRRVDSGEAMRAALADATWDAITCDYLMPGFSGAAALQLLHDSGLDLPFILVSGKVSEEIAVDMMKAGAHDFVLKSNLSRLVPALRREIRDAENRRRARLAQAILKESEARFHLLARVSPVGIFQTDAQGACLYVNERWCDMAGLPAESALGDGWLNTIHPEDRARVAAEWAESVKHNRPFYLEYRFRRPDGKETWVLGRASAETSDSGLVGSYVGTVTDISELKLAQWRLGERVKEQAGLFAIAELASQPELSGEGLLRAVLRPLCAALQHPERAWARVRHLDAVHATANCSESGPVLSTALRIGQAVEGSVEVGYTELAAGAAGEPFFPEERAFLEAAARTLGAALAMRRANQALKESERDLKEAQRVARVGSWIWHVASDTVIWSEETFRMAGRDPAFGAPSLAQQAALYTEESWLRLQVALDNAVRTGAPVELDVELAGAIAAKGTRWAAVRGHAERDAAGHVVRVHGTALDITERKRAEQRIEELARFPKENPSAVLRIAGDGALLYANPASEPLLPLLGVPIGARVGEPWLAHVDQTLRSGGLRTIEVEHAGRVYLMTFTPIEPFGYVNVYGMDITERRKAEKALEESRARYRALTEHGSDVLIVLDAAGSITYASPSLTALGGYTVDEVMGKRFSDFSHPEDLASAAANFERLVRNPGVPYPAELRYRHKNGRYLMLASISKNALDDPALRGIVVNAHDVTERRRMEDRLRLANAVVDNSPTVLYRVRGGAAEDPVEYVSQNLRHFGYEPDDLIAGKLSYMDLVHEEDRRRIEKEVPGAIAAGERQCQIEYRLVRPDGGVVWVEDHITFERDAAGTLVAHEGVLRDITERKMHQLRIARLDRIRSVLSAINSTIVRVREEAELFKDACQIAVEKGQFRLAWIGLVGPEAAGVRVAASAGTADGFLSSMVECGHFSPSVDPVASVLKQRQPVTVNDLDDEACPVCRASAASHGFSAYAMLPLVVGDTATGVLALYSGERGVFDEEEMSLLTELAADVGFGWEHIVTDRKVSYLALYDALTGLANRTLFVERLQQQLAQARDTGQLAALALIDIERFQNVNDTLGWHAGDALLKEIAARLKQVVGEAAIARIDADCFALTARDPSTASMALQGFQQALRQAFGRAFQWNGEELRLAARCGVALFPNDGFDADALLKNAAVALKKARDAQESVLFYAPEMNARVSERLTLESRLHTALEREQFELYYQPKLDSKSGALAGLEALIRWNDPERGLISPAQFIPLLEETGLILSVGRWALHRAVAQCREWRAAGFGVPRIAVNVSAIQLRQKDFVAVVLEALGGGPPGCLDVEITESLIMRDIEDNIAKLQALREAGVASAIDDFGTGYSSLAYLAKLPVDTLKIDRSFVVGMPTSSQHMGIVSSLIGLAHNLDLKVVAEGVDSEEQAHLLRLLKCDQMQGYLFSKPKPAAGIAEMLKDGSPARAPAG